ncbi:MAG: NAD(P)H-hydrate epimerase [Candidatus Dormiibacterota bacterium]
MTERVAASASAEQSRSLDAASTQLGTSVEALMAVAGFQCARLTQILLEEMKSPGPVAVLAGRGNNGGDALGCARHLAVWGVKVRALTLANMDSAEAAAARQTRAARASGVEVRHVGDGGEEAIAWALAGSVLVVDGLLGTGSTGPLQGVVLDAVRQLNHAGARVLSIDVPTGLEATGGSTDRDAVRADDTLMLAIPKSGCLIPGASAFVGRLWLADIGIPAQAYFDSGISPPKFWAGGLQRYPATADGSLNQPPPNSGRG